MQIGQLVKFRDPHTEAEAAERFVVVELRDARILVQCANHEFYSWQIKPQAAYFATDLVPV